MILEELEVCSRASECAISKDCLGVIACRPFKFKCGQFKDRKKKSITKWRKTT